MNPEYHLGDWLVEDADGSRHTIVDVGSSGDLAVYTLIEVYEGEIHRGRVPEDTLNWGFTLVASAGDSR